MTEESHKGSLPELGQGRHPAVVRKLWRASIGTKKGTRNQNLSSVIPVKAGIQSLNEIAWF